MWLRASPHRTQLGPGDLTSCKATFTSQGTQPCSHKSQVQREDGLQSVSQAHWANLGLRLRQGVIATLSAFWDSVNDEMSLLSASRWVRSTDANSGHCGPFLRVSGTITVGPSFLSVSVSSPSCLPRLLSFTWTSVSLLTALLGFLTINFLFFPGKKTGFALLHRHGQAYHLSQKMQTYSQNVRLLTHRSFSSSKHNIK